MSQEATVRFLVRAHAQVVGLVTTTRTASGITPRGGLGRPTQKGATACGEMRGDRAAALRRRVRTTNAKLQRGGSGTVMLATDF